ncbi:MAG: hypothetical protein J6T10_11290 [Methanobrevibacter sp.]|nr:hypothetical protein [Methanobrevibacter sp.]
MLQRFKVYEYPLENYYCSYTIKAEAKPCCFENERLVDEFEAFIRKRDEK